MQNTTDGKVRSRYKINVNIKENNFHLREWDKVENLTLHFVCHFLFGENSFHEILTSQGTKYPISHKTLLMFNVEKCNLAFTGVSLISSEFVYV